MNFRWTILLGLMLATCALHAQGGRPPMQKRGDRPEMGQLLRDYPWLGKALMAQRKLRYSGTRVVEFKLEGERYRNVEVVIVDGPRSRIEYAPGSAYAGQVVVETPRGRLQYDPQSNSIEQVPPRRDEMMARFVRMLREADRMKLKIQHGSGGAIAGRNSDLTTVADANGNLMTKLWIDSDTGLILKRELFDRDGSRAGYFEFQRVNFNPIIDPKDFEINRKGAKVITPEQRLKKTSADMGFDVLRLSPTGPWRLESSKVIKFGDKRIHQQVYSGQGGRVSLFHFQGAIDAQRLRRMAGRTLGAYSWESKGVWRMIVGDRSTEELKTLADNLVHQ